MVYFFKKGIIRALFLICFSTVLQAQDWREQMELLIYAPRYFGPNAFPLPELRSGQVGCRYEVEVRGEYHYYTGDRTKDAFARIYLPFVKGRAALEVSGVLREYYETTEATKEERFAVEGRPPIPCYGDVIFSSFYQVLRSDAWFDAMFSCNLKTASGGRLCDARFTDAATYWFDLTLGRNIIHNQNHSAYLRVQGMAGFYCWMTNDMVHRQNDATLYGVGLSAGYGALSFMCDYSGFYGYQKFGDSPSAFRYKLECEYRKNILSLRYRHGMRDNLYDLYSVAYIRCF